MRSAVEEQLNLIALGKVATHFRSTFHSFGRFINCRLILILCCNMAWTYSNSSFNTFAITLMEWMNYLKPALLLWQKEENLYHGNWLTTVTEKFDRVGLNLVIFADGQSKISTTYSYFAVILSFYLEHIYKL